ncbi:hypothetical protein CWI38_0102p0010 [Hamiltosporidium tvaerminnensis]|uniref:Uncharacterized protein n=1 Tax=Hamiltosporidium tvaerminnensis TaxID=1176355 RepID=A0A4Q9M400_9MICR|nr:hypothetical protein CWI38_0102p0010 [Hamiltosporidium tvaerminnensis]
MPGAELVWSILCFATPYNYRDIPKEAKARTDLYCQGRINKIYLITDVFIGKITLKTTLFQHLNEYIQKILIKATHSKAYTNKNADKLVSISRPILFYMFFLLEKLVWQ